jgi:excisionase family DNA binding protein
MFDSTASLRHYQKISDVALELGVSKQHVRNLISSGDIAPAYRVGGLILVPKKSLRNFMQRAIVQPDTAAA